jgi:hypothetical protein
MGPFHVGGVLQGSGEVGSLSLAKPAKIGCRVAKPDGLSILIHGRQVAGCGQSSHEPKDIGLTSHPPRCLSALRFWLTVDQDQRRSGVSAKVVDLVDAEKFPFPHPSSQVDSPMVDEEAKDHDASKHLLNGVGGFIGVAILGKCEHGRVEERTPRLIVDQHREAFAAFENHCFDSVRAGCR